MNDPMDHDQPDNEPIRVPPKRLDESEIKDDGLQFLHETEADRWWSIYELLVNDKMWPELAADRAVKAYRMRAPLFTKEYIAKGGSNEEFLGGSTG